MMDDADNEILQRELTRYGLPKDAGLAGLLMHIEGNNSLVYTVNQLTIKILRDRLDARGRLISNLQKQLQDAGVVPWKETEGN
jgi:hypothetical protein